MANGSPHVLSVPALKVPPGLEPPLEQLLPQLSLRCLRRFPANLHPLNLLTGKCCKHNLSLATLLLLLLLLLLVLFC